MSTHRESFPEFLPDTFPDISLDDHLKFCGNGELNDGFFAMGLHFGDQPGLTSPADARDFSLLHDASPTSPSVHLQPCFDMPTSAGPSALTQGLREWDNSVISSTVVSPTMDLLSDDLITACNMDSEPFNPLFLTEGGSMTSFNATSSENSSFSSSVGGIPIPQQNHTFSEYSFCSEPSLGYTGSSFNSDRSFDTLYAAHKQNELLAPPQQSAAAVNSQSQPCSWQPQSQPQRNKSVYVQRTRRLTGDQLKRFTPTSVGSSMSKNTLSFIHCRPSEDSGRMLTYGTEHSPNAKRPRGRKNPLTPDQKKHAALMRRVKACDSCRQRKEKCDPGIPCKACIEHFRTDLVRQPCRGKTLEDLTPSMLSDELGWCPMERTLDTYFGPGAYTIAPEISFVNLKLGFGPPLLTQVRRVIPDHPSQLIHSHIVYDWPFRSGHAMLGSSPHQDDHSVLPAILADTSDLRNELDKHLSKLINDELSFRQFPLYNSPLRILKHIYMLYRDLSDTGHRHLLHTALKLLVLVHIGDQTELDTSVPLFYTFSNNNSVYNMKPCFIRGQLGAVIPSLAQDLLREALSKLEFICLARRCTDWPPVLAALATLCMAVESVQYHAAKKPYHAHFGASSSFDNSSSTAALNDSMFLNPNVLVFGPERPPPDTTNGVHSSSSSINEDEADSDTASLVSLTHEESANRLIAFYRTCYRGCHCSRLQDFDPASSSSRRARRQQAEQDAVSARFIDGLKGSLRNAREYLVQRRHAGGSVLKMMGAKMGRGLRDYGRNGDVGSQEHGSPVDMSIFFDRLLAKLFLD